MPRRKILDQAVRAIGQLPGWPDVRVVDLSCGDGYLLEELARKGGARIEGSHFREDDYIFKSPSEILRSIPLHRGVDLTRPLPFGDSEYDVVVATEVIEHLPSIIPLLGEIERILKPGGHLIVSTPNVHQLLSRVQFLFTGQHILRSARLGWHVPAEDVYTTHHNPVYFPVLHTLLHHRRLHVRRLYFTGCRWGALALAPLYPVFALATAIEARHAITRSPAGGWNLLRWMLDVRMAFSDQLMVFARKDGHPPEPPP